MKVVVDGVERARFDLLEKKGAHLTIPEESELIEVFGPGDVLLAVCLIDDRMLEDGWENEIVLEGGQEIRFRIAFSGEDAMSSETLDLEVGYRETRLGRIAKLAAARAGL